VFTVAVVHGSGTDTLRELLVENVLDLVDSVEPKLLTSDLVEPIELPLEVPEGGCRRTVSAGIPTCKNE